MTIGERIKRLRELKGISQIDLAKQINISKQNLYKYENNIITNIPSDKIERISQVLRVSPAYLMGWEVSKQFNAPTIAEETVTYPVIGEVAAGYDKIAIEDWDGDTVDIPTEYLKGRHPDEFFVLRVIGDSMYPIYINGDKVLVLKQSTLNNSGDVGVIIYDNDYSSLKKIEYKQGEDWLELVPINPMYPRERIEGERLEHCRVIGIPRYLIREINK